MRDRRVSWTQDLAWRAEAVAYDVFTFLMRLMPTDFASDVGGWLFRRFS